MKRCLTGILSLGLLLAVCAGAGQEIFLHCGSILKVDRLKENSPTSFVSLEAALKGERLLPGAAVPKHWLAMKKAEKGLVWLILTVRVDEKKSIGIPDYRLIADGKSFLCMGLAEDDNSPFDIRRQKFAGPGTVRMVYQIPARAPEASLKCAYDKLIVPEIFLNLPPPPAPVVKKPAPVAKKPASAVKKPAPAAAKQPASAVKKPAPAAVKKPASAVKKPAPAAAKQPASAVKKPASAAKKPASAVKKKAAPAVKKKAAPAGKKKGSSAAEKQSSRKKDREKK